MTMFDIGTELENIKITLNRVDDLLDIFEEIMVRDLDDMDGSDSWAIYMRKRFDRMRSILDVMSQQHGDAISALGTLIDTVYAVSKQEKANRKQT